jgi:nitrate reductase gamma subunit
MKMKMTQRKSDVILLSIIFAVCVLGALAVWLDG